MRGVAILTLIGLAWLNPGEVWAVDPYAGVDPFWVLIHEPAVIEELKLSPEQQRSYRELLDRLDLRFLPLRNKPHDEALAGLAQITTEVRQKLKSLLQPAQAARLTAILLRKSENGSFLDEEVATRLRYSEAQRRRIRDIADDTRAAVASLQKETTNGKSRESFQRKYTELKTAEQKKMLQVLEPSQRTTLKTLIGASFDVSRLGHPAYKAPELVETGEWINSQPLQLQQLRGKVVVVHFYAFGCINCIHNFPSYREWHERFADKDVVMVGIHTPETAAERDVTGVRRRAADEKLDFPILIDGRNENWNAWGNSMWPSVYLIDKRGYVRDFWPGELKWQGADGDKRIRRRIERLLAESGD